VAMSDRPIPEPPRPDDVERDLRSLHAVTGERLASLDSHLHAARGRAERERRFMTGFRWVRWTVAAGAAVVLIALLVPVSYNKTTGQDVALTFSAPGLQESDVRTLAQRFGTEMGGGPVQVTAASGDHDVAYTLHGFVPAKGGRNANAVAQAFVGVLQSSGYQASAAVTPRVERVSGSVYAMAMDEVIRINGDGKTASQLQAEIRDRLVEAGVPNPQVSVTDADGRREVNVRVESDKPQDPSQTELAPSIVITHNGQDVPDANRCEVRIKKAKNDAGALQLTVDVTYKGSTAQAVVENADTIGDAAIASAIESQLKAAGLNAKVEVTDGKVKITPVE
jgi:hypothetical protein